MSTREARNKILNILNESDDVRTANADVHQSGNPAISVEFMDDSKRVQYTLVVMSE